MAGKQYRFKVSKSLYIIFYMYCAYFLVFMNDEIKLRFSFA